ncbi:MAG: hypothetical protein JNJ59_17255 [Deltaproteobacteria bacterium]|nr:hypothetical protein [Deltaproteobacteria bacterium]
MSNQLSKGRTGRLGVVAAGVMWAGLAAGAMGACSEREAAPSTTNLAVNVAPLDLKDVTNARYTLTVRAKGEVVWTRAVDADAFGDGRGGLAYVGPCDASPDAQPNSVTVVLDALVGPTSDLPPSSWQNPTPVTANFTCRENADTPVTFNLTIMRRADQGFFDIAVTFEDVFCSAKFDCQDELLHDGGTRGLTGVMAFACAAGKDTSTVLYLSDVVLACEGQAPVVVNPSLGPGQRVVTASPLFAVATYWGKEGFPDLDKCYWNTALGLTFQPASAGGVNASDCELRATGTAVSTLLDGGRTPANTRYPIIQWTVPLTDADGRLTCGAHALDSGDGAVKTRYTDPSGEALGHPYVCGQRPGLSCTGRTATVAGQEILVNDLGSGRVQVDIAGTSATLQLPEGATLDDEVGCCISPCCDLGPALP